MRLTLTTHLLDLLTEAAAGLPEVTQRPMFGCEVLFARGRGFALIWKGRIGVKLPDPETFEDLLAKDGTGRWTLSKRTAVSVWLLVPESFHDDEEELRRWVQKAHALGLANPRPAKRATAKPRAKAKAARVGTKRPARKR